ncbi:MAG: DNA-binding response regulator, partial [Clostridiales bacterium]
MVTGEKKGRILIADDEEKIRSLIRKYAEFEGYEVAEAVDGMQAVLMAEDQNFDI